MDVFCIEEFKSQFETLKKNNSYKDLEKTLVEELFLDSNTEKFKNGARINGSNEEPYLRKRFSGSSGYRCHYLLVVTKNKLYLMYIHPKTGALGFDNTSNDFNKHLYKELLKSIKNKNYYQLSSNDKKELVFKHVSIAEDVIEQIEGLASDIEKTETTIVSKSKGK